MHIMFVCTGNICRSPMGELLMSRYLANTTVQVTSAGTRGLPMHQIDPSSARLMDSVGIDSSGFRSRRLTREMAESADLILCFEAAQRKEIVTIAPMAVRSSFIRPLIAAPKDIADPHGREFAKFRQAAEETNRALRMILTSMRKHYRVESAPVRPQITRPDFDSIIYAS